MSNEVTSPFPVFYDSAGQPLNAGYIYVGTAGLNPETSPITVYWDNALTITAAQPIRTLNGYPSRSGSPSSMAISQSSYSIAVRDSAGVLVYSNLNFSPDSGLVHISGTETITGDKTFTANPIVTNSAPTISLTEVGAGATTLQIVLDADEFSIRPNSSYVNAFKISSVGFVTATSGGSLSGGYTLTSPTINGATVSGTWSGKLLLNSTQTTIPAAGAAGQSLQISNTDTSYGLLVGTRSSDGSSWLQAQRVDATATTYKLLLNPTGGLVYVGPAGIQAPVAISTETTGTLTSASANTHVACTGNITLNNSVFAAGDKITFDPGTSARTFTRGAGIAMYVNGVDSASATLAANQMGGVHWRSASVAVLSGVFT